MLGPLLEARPGVDPVEWCLVSLSHDKNPNHSIQQPPHLLCPNIQTHTSPLTELPLLCTSKVINPNLPGAEMGRRCKSIQRGVYCFRYSTNVLNQNLTYLLGRLECHLELSQVKCS